MAREKKAAKELSAEERLQRALVPVEEQPYPIPENWCWVRLGRLCADIQYGYTAKAIFDISQPKMLRITDIQEGEVDWDRVPNCNIDNVNFEKYKLTHNDIVFVRTGATTGKSYLVLEPPKAVYASYLIRIRINDSLNKKYVYYVLQSDVYWKQIMELSSGIAQPGVNATKLQSLIFPLSPVAEQYRIADRIESLFVKLDEAKEKAQAVVDSWELRKSAILHKAFTGKLTEQWRKEHKISDADWRIVRFDEVAEIKSNLVDPADYQDFPHIAPDNIEKNTGVLLEYHTIAEDGVKSGKHLFRAGQILYSKIRPYLSKVIIVDFDGLCSADMYPIDAKENVRYLWYYMLSDEFLEQASNAGSRSVLPKINQKELSKIMVRITSLDEQQAIAIILDEIFKREQQAKEDAEAVLDQIDTMKKAILARAFRGELGTNDPAEEWAGKLVKKLLSEKN